MPETSTTAECHLPMTMATATAASQPSSQIAKKSGSRSSSTTAAFQLTICATTVLTVAAAQAVKSKRSARNKHNN